jgi:hypothetical protein
MTLFQEGNTVSNNKLIFPLALKTIRNLDQYCDYRMFKSRYYTIEYIFLNNKQL